MDVHGTGLGCRCEGDHIHASPVEPLPDCLGLLGGDHEDPVFVGIEKSDERVDLLGFGLEYHVRGTEGESLALDVDGGDLDLLPVLLTEEGFGFLPLPLLLRVLLLLTDYDLGDVLQRLQDIRGLERFVDKTLDVRIVPGNLFAGALDQDDVERHLAKVLLATADDTESILVPDPCVEHDDVRLEIPDLRDGLVHTADALNIILGIAFVQKDVLDDLLDGDVVIDD